MLLLNGMDPYDGTQRWSLPGGFVHPGERLADTVRRVLRAKCGIEGLEPRQLRVFDDPSGTHAAGSCRWPTPRPCRARSLSEAMDGRSDLRLGAGCPGRARTACAMPRGQKRLPFDHDDDRLVGGHRRCADRYSRRRIRTGCWAGCSACGNFSASTRRWSGRPWHKDAFRRLMEPHLVAAHGKDRSGYGPPAQLFQRRDDAPVAAYPAEVGAPSAGYTDEELLSRSLTT